MDALLRRRAMIAAGVSPTPPTPSPSLIFSLSGDVTTANYDTEVQLFDEPKSFTILFEASFNNYSWTSAQGMMGVGSDNYFRYGSIRDGKDYKSGEVIATANRYTAIIMNTSASGKNCASLDSRQNAVVTRKVAIRYDHTTRLVKAFVSHDMENRWWVIDGDVTTSDTLKLLVGNASGTVMVCDIYDGLLTDTQIETFITAS